MKLLDKPFPAARASIQALVQPRQPGGEASEAQVLIAHILTTVDTLTADSKPVSSAESEELLGYIWRAIELVAPLDAPTGRMDAPERLQNLTVRAWVEDAFRLLTAHLSGF